MFPVKRIEKMHEELERYYLQVVTYQNEDQEYQDIVTKLSKNLSELQYTIKYKKKYNKHFK